MCVDIKITIPFGGRQAYIMRMAMSKLFVEDRYVIQSKIELKMQTKIYMGPACLRAGRVYYAL